MIKYTALCNFTALVAGLHKQFVKGEIYETEVAEPELDSYIQLRFVTKEVIEQAVKKPKK